MIERRYKQKTLAEALADRQRAKARAQRRAGNVRFIAKMQGVDVLASRSTIIAKLDHLFSLFIRRRDRAVAGGKCVICLIRPIEHCFHWITRGNYSTRWDPENACGSCRGCNLEETYRPMKYRDIHVKIIGLEAREAIELRSRTKSHFTVPDLIDKLNEIKRWLGALI